MKNCEVICGIFLLILGSTLVIGQTPTSLPASLSALNEIKSFETSTLSSLMRPVNILRDEVYGHFFRSQNVLRLARENLFSTASKFPYYQLEPEVRQNMVKRLSTIINECIDPTVDYLQKNAILPYFNFMSDEKTPVESSFEPVMTQLEGLKAIIESSDKNSCLRSANINSRRLTTRYNSVINAVNSCTRSASMTYRAPITEFTRLHFAALPLVNRMNTELNQCTSILASTLGTESNSERTNECLKAYLEKYCEDEEQCKVCSTISAVKDQARNMVTSTQAEYNECITETAKKLPATIPFSESLKSCSPAEEVVETLPVEEVEEVIKEEGEGVDVITDEENDVKSLH
ncbi:CLUMA_CG016348, isoform A [Clunio marinus]|uniref:CLUMA_CG016348, isoform A n=1 Tax=Clunio marinus TaxID=568069 RepID=A0A1J1IXY6_9DIPT|nr:CLUMA_CG016348, isoform A [Clunio marinus]